MKKLIILNKCFFFTKLGLDMPDSRKLPIGVEYNLLDAKSTNKENPRRNANIFSILSFWWLNNFLFTGSRRSLENEDLFPLLKVVP